MPAEAISPLPGENWAIPTELADLEDTAQFAAALAKHLRAGDLLVLTGGLGTGKTTFTQSLAAALEVEGQVNSPTFVLSRIHRSTFGGPYLVHVDAYRTDTEGIESLDLVSTMPDSVTVVEWGRGVIEQTLLGSEGSWLDVELARNDSVGPGGDQSGPASSSPDDIGAGGIVTDFSESEEDVLGTPRTAVLRGYGPRWETSPELHPAFTCG